VRLFQHGLFAKSDGVPDAEISDGFDAERQGELAAKDGRLDDADPPDADSLRARGEPQVLDGAARAGAHGLGLHGGTEDGLVAVAQIDHDADIQGRFEDAFELVGEVSVAPRRRKTPRFGLAASEKALPDALACLPLAHQHETPRLRESHARRAVRAFQDPFQGLEIDVDIRAEVPDIAPKGNDLVNGPARIVGKDDDGFRLEETGGQAHAPNDRGVV
jgi:hypothetical protein